MTSDLESAFAEWTAEFTKLAHLRGLILETDTMFGWTFKDRSGAVLGQISGLAPFLEIGTPSSVFENMLTRR